MNKNNIVNQKYKTNENVLKKASPNYKNLYSSYFNVEKKINANTFGEVKYTSIKK